MPLLGLILLFTAVQTFGEALTSRGLFFYTNEILHYSDAQNLLLYIPFALAAGLSALFVSHRLADALGERRALLLCLIVRIAGDLMIYLQPTSMSMIAIGGALRWGGGGALWSIVESYVTAGRSSKDAGRAVGLFNVTWSLTIPFSLMAVGPLLKYRPDSLFLIAAGFHVVCVVLAVFLPRQPTHLPDEHPHRLTRSQIEGLTPLLISCRWSAIASTTLMNIVVAIMPGILKDMGQPIVLAPSLAAVLDWSRFAAFVILGWYAGWHGRRLVPTLIAASMPPGVLLILLAPNMAALVTGQVLLGLALGAAYSASLYYNLLLHNHSVKGAGRHEGIASLGGAIGPIILTGTAAAATALHVTQASGILVGTAPLLAAGALLALWPLRRKSTA